MTDNEFIDYCEMHSMTERKLFSAEQITRLGHLAGMEAAIDLQGWYSVDLTDWCKTARESS
jgi:hypothetical protein